MIANTPSPPYYAVIFTSTRTNNDDGYGDTAKRMVELAREQDGFLGVESARDDSVGITVSYWRDLKAIKMWKMHAEHTLAREKGRSDWYSAFKTRIALVERDYGFSIDE
ncbi:MAG: antibiotic biosynthesis monooxygenase [Saprospiraceae bacterium]